MHKKQLKITRNLIVNVKGANVAKVPKPAQKKATVKPKPEEIITSPILLAMKDAVGAAIRRKGVNLKMESIFLDVQYLLVKCLTKAQFREVTQGG
ncbi:hypothetical protein K7X08_001745 [Anisodus acutangulus]|uniref:Uncharacterized protein n=1 Tax=Anisodus acutangulus TaxID=402998 RepID=A0A9Q1LPC3_9SOLA|nr:hypothetical protein K7X08_001745 [Anisodus acutangulus]